MKPCQAWEYAAQWGSFVRIGDPGACMYGFSRDCRPQSESHRADCLGYIDARCLPAVLAGPAHYDSDEVGKLRQLRRYLASAPLRDAA
jgi:hypothetical protein